jgi:hypothetical protein
MCTKFGLKCAGKKSCGRPRHREQQQIAMDGLKVVESDDEDRIQDSLAQDLGLVAALVVSVKYMQAL